MILDVVAVHPLTGAKLPIFVTDYVLDHATAAVMGLIIDQLRKKILNSKGFLRTTLEIMNSLYYKDFLFW